MTVLKRWEVKAALAVLVVVFATPTALYHYFKYRQVAQYKAAVAQAGPVTDVVFIGGKSGPMRPACGIAVFRLAPTAQGGGVASRYPAAAGWTPTPYVLATGYTGWEDLWMRGIDCAGMDVQLAGQISAALKKPGAYVNRHEEDALVVIPYLNLVALVYYD